jgi:hypothetical protein
MDPFIEKQNIRMVILDDFLTNYDDGRAKNFFCQTSALLPIDKLQETYNEVKKVIAIVDLKEKSKSVRKIITETADSLGIDLKLKNKR